MMPNRCSMSSHITLLAVPPRRSFCRFVIEWSDQGYGSGHDKEEGAIGLKAQKLRLLAPSKETPGGWLQTEQSSTDQRISS